MTELNIPLKDEKVRVKVDDMWGVGRMELRMFKCYAIRDISIMLRAGGDIPLF